LENGTSGTAAKDASTSIDFKVSTDKTYINGGQLLIQNATWGDWIEAQVVDIDNVLGYGSNVVLNQYIYKRFIHPGLSSVQLNLPYAGKIPQNCYLRIIYHNTSTTTDAQIAMNYYLHKLN